MDLPDSTLICRLGNKLVEILSGQADTGEKLKAIADYDKELFIRPWLKELPWIAQVTADLDNLRKVLVASATATAELPAQAAATAELPAQAAATAELPAQAAATV